MQRLIDANALKLSHCKECTLYPNKCMGKDCDCGAIIHINEMPTIDAVPQWIPCSERMPSKGEYVLATCDDDVLIMEYDGAVWETVEESIKYETSDIVAWMPLPEPYEVEE